MKATYTLQRYELVATNQRKDYFVSSVTGKKGSTRKRRSFGAVVLVVALIVVFSSLLSLGNMIPSMISERLIEAFDVQWADAVESKILVFKAALENGRVPKVTADSLKEIANTFNNYSASIGFIKDGEFMESNKNDSGELVIKVNDEIIKPKDFVSKVHNDYKLYKAFDAATYSRAAYYYDEPAMKVIKKYSSRNNYTSDSELSEVIDTILGDGNDISANGVYLSKTEENGEEKVEYVENSEAAHSKSSATEFISNIVSRITGPDKNSATINTASVINIADNIAKEDKSKCFYVGTMENFSKMKAGEGGDSEINAELNYLLTNSSSEAMDVHSGGLVTLTGSALESPSMYAVLANKKVNYEDVENFASDRVIKVVENQLEGTTSYDAITTNVASTSNGAKSTIGRLNTGSETSDSEVINLTSPMISSSVFDNSLEKISGIYAGELLVEGATNLGKELARMSGATAGDEEAVFAYTKLNNSILALEAKADRLDRSPFDITSRNTFLGSIIYNMAFVWGNTGPSILSKSTTVFSTTQKSLASILPITYADETPGYLSNFGNCKTFDTIGVVGSVQCAEIATFDVTTLDDPYNNPEFVNFVENNTTLDASGNRVVKEGSLLDWFIRFMVNRTTSLGVADGGSLSALSEGASLVPFVSDIASMVKSFTESSEKNKLIATGELFVNSKNNPFWGEFRLAQRYVSLARADALLKQAAEGDDAYNDLRYFEGIENPVMALLNSYNQVAEH